MDKKATRAYEKAMNYYEKGKINKALDICEEILSEGLDNPTVLNFKGLLLYQKGNLNDAITVWKLNSDLNNDSIAEKYIKDSVADEERLELYKLGEQALTQLKVDRALGFFSRCAESGFNSIKVNTAIALCYQKKGDFYRAKEYVDKALCIDQNEIIAKNIEKELKENGVYLESKNKSKKNLVLITILFVIIAISTGGYAVISKIKGKNINNIAEKNGSKSLEEENIGDKNKETEDKEKVQVNSENSPSENKNEVQNTNIDKKKLDILISNNDLDGIYEQIKNVQKESINSEDSEIYKKAVDLMKNQGVSKFYESGLNNFNQSNYTEAKQSLDKAYTYCEGSSLKEHILFYRASASSKLSDKAAISQFEEYYKQYPKGVYTQEALYELALLNDSIDKEKSKTYANTLIKNYPNSIYVNDNIVGILKS
ncbi:MULTISPECIES: tetratricopeptide repeat protein [unclassified Clostridium]|uniref:tetratricopeptide repeat protein n=1 Tax=unclassified Clostridium TaxID=2614128 RepID=UPI00029849FC|nr:MULTISPECIES: tetratricopeptide repeat protein [unclassified Clostridium]EKQ52180.1 MAG: hypothetical protein A370_04338 [Clostridium sp. Maddingley MBC34-26]